MNDFNFTLSRNDLKTDKNFVLSVVVIQDANLFGRDYGHIGSSLVEPVPYAQDKSRNRGYGLRAVSDVLHCDFQLFLRAVVDGCLGRRLNHRTGI